MQGAIGLTGVKGQKGDSIIINSKNEKIQVIKGEKGESCDSNCNTESASGKIGINIFALLFFIMIFSENI